MGTTAAELSGRPDSTTHFTERSHTHATVRRHPAARTRRQYQLLYAATDLFVVWASGLISLLIRFPHATESGVTLLALLEHAGFLVLYSVFVIVAALAYDAYPRLQPRPATRAVWLVTKAVAAATIMLTFVVYSSGVKIISRQVIATTTVMTFAGMVAWRLERRRRIRVAIAAGRDCRNVLIVGAGHDAEAVAEHLRRFHHFGYAVKGYIDRRDASRSASTATARRYPLLGRIDDLAAIARKDFIDEILIVLPEDREVVKRVAAEARAAGIDVRVVIDLYDGLGWGAPVENLGHFPTLHLHHRREQVVSSKLKRAIDVAGALMALLLVSPILAAVAIAIKLDSRGPLVYRSARVGKKGTIFTCYKFRTMVANAEALKKSLEHLNERDGILFKISNDPRITRVGAFLRKYSLDELPQLFNVLKGDMSLVGPRPPIPGEFAQYEIDHFKRLNVQPGITGLWQVEARENPSFDSYIELDSRYVDCWSVWLDLEIMLRTVTVVVKGTGQ